MVDFASVPHTALYVELLLEPILPTYPINSDEVASTQHYQGCLISA